MLAKSREANALEYQTQVTQFNNQKITLSREAIKNLKLPFLCTDCHSLMDYGVWWVIAVTFIYKQKTRDRKISGHILFSRVSFGAGAGAGAFPTLDLNFMKLEATHLGVRTL